MKWIVTAGIAVLCALLSVGWTQMTTTTPAPRNASDITAIDTGDVTASVSSVTNGGVRAGVETAGPTGAPPQLPVWAQCLAKAPVDAPSDSSVVSLFRHWCSNYETVIPCVMAGLSTAAAQNPLDMFIKLHFDSAALRARSERVCQTFRGLGTGLQCTQKNNATLEAWCRARFSQGMQYVFAIQMQKAFENEPNIYKELACQVTEDTSGCQGSAMTGCDAMVKGHLIAYYGLLSNESCVADPSVPYTTPAPPPTPKPLPHDVVVTCAQRVAQTVPPSGTLPENATLIQQLNYGLRQNCRSFEARYNCYDQELGQLTSPTFRDIWLSFTFDSANAIKSQREFCQAFEGGVIGQLNEECYRSTQPSLQRCEGQYGSSVVSLQRQYTDRQVDEEALHKAACRASMQRAFCLRDAFKQCSAALGETMLASELGTLPDICFTLPLPGSNSTSTTSTVSSGQDIKTTGQVPAKVPKSVASTISNSPRSLACLVPALGLYFIVWRM